MMKRQEKELSMGKDYEKPEYINVKREEDGDTEKKAKAIQSIKHLLKSELFGVLATNAKNESYTSLISFVMNEDSTLLAFSTPIQTKKYKMIEENENVSLLIDNRSNNEKDINNITAVTALGKGRILKDDEEIKKWSEILVDKHSYLDDFIYADTSAIILVEIANYHYVSHFQKVVEWNPN